MTNDAKTTRAAYFAQAESWAHDRAASARKTTRIAWIIAGVASTIALCEAFALMALTPLKTVEPYTLLVDKQTGFVQALKPLDPQAIAGDTALTQSFLVQYVIAREGYDRATIRDAYRKVALWSAGSARTAYVASMRASHPDSPLASYTRSTIVDVRIKSVTPLNRGVALVRYDTQRADNERTRPAQAWVAVVRYAFSSAPMSTADRFVNPLGFQVLSYRRSIEVLPPPAPVDAAPTASETERPVARRGATSAPAPVRVGS